MFGFLKEKLRNAAKIFSRKVEEEGEEVKPAEKEPITEIEESFSLGKKTSEKEEDKREKDKRKDKKERKEKPAKKDEFKKKKKEIVQEEETEKLSDEELEEIDGELKPAEPEMAAKKEEVKFFEKETFGREKEEHEEQIAEEPREETLGKEHKKGWFARLKEKVTEKVTTTKIDAGQFEDFFQELEYALLENNVAAEVIEKIKEDLKKQLVDKPLKKGKVEQLIEEGLGESIQDVLRESDFDLLKAVKEKKEKPYVILFVGVNGSGKTTSIAKIAYYLKEHKISCVLAAGDTFRAASIEQLEEHGLRLGVRVIKQKYGSDPAAVVFDAISHAKSRHIDCVLVDTAGRQHSNQDLMQEMKKIARVAQPDLKLFVGEAITGNDCVEQVREFNKAVELDGIILSKLDVDEKGGAALSVSYVSGKPILFVGVGQKYGDLERFSKEKIIGNLGIKA